PPPPLEVRPHALGVSVLRRVQESLTNVLKHAGQGAAAAVRPFRTADELVSEVLDDGQGVDPGSDGQGHGLTGMRERMSVFGGTLSAGPLPSRGYRVRAGIPLQGGDRTDRAGRGGDRQDPYQIHGGTGTDPDDPGS